MTSQAKVKKNQQPLTGIVVSNKMDKTVKVRVDDILKDEQYKKYRKRYRNFMAHDENNQCEIDDVVMISQARPFSKTKAWKVERIIK